MRTLAFVLALPLLVAIAWLGLHGNSPRAAEAAKPAVQKLEYRQVNWNLLQVGATLKDLGAEGWEMCGVIPEEPSADTAVIFKRPKQ
jgi:hypothetical protein